MAQVATVRSATGSADLAVTLEAYGFEGITADTPDLLAQWVLEFPAPWPSLAIVEAVYQGRYKVHSVRQILLCWQRRGEPRINFDRSFQRQILEEIWQPLIPTPVLPALPPQPEPAIVPTVHLGQQPVVNRLRELLGAA
ncbi:hypothetical protein [Anthocerotibacter panamensis]|uniref:hypothetical protein n=1 Tax=Anthocerotibacter panamensis TaxID=2857077 RepID=UPI001C408A39|nr:hypothetical protein [Anthocerotibacter panamensis]